MTTVPASTGDLAVLVLQRNATEFLEHVPGARAGVDPHHVHQMRVATRRMRAALRLFSDLLPPDSRSLDEELKWFASQLGPVRDLDVQIHRMHATAAELGIAEALAPYAAWLEQQQRRARATLAEAFESRRFGALVQHLQRLDECALEDNPPLFGDAPRRLQRAYKHLRRRADAVDHQALAADLHAVRIRAKRLRYTAEFFELAYGRPARRLVERVVTLQDVLGNLQDGVVSREHIHAALQSSANTWPAQTSVALGQLLQLDAQRDRELRTAFHAAYSGVRGSRWQGLRKALRDGQSKTTS
ncbi:MAG: CHAD domain-containing protein [Chloroflexota bacterium]